MAIKSTTKEARQAIKDYIMEHWDGAGYDGAPADGCQDFHTVALFIWDTFQVEKRYAIQDFHRIHGGTWQDLFQDWCQGLPSVLDTCYYYNRDAKPDVMRILHQTGEEASKYTEQVACDYLTHLIYREIKREVDRK